jgi:hypothetical protein
MKASIAVALIIAGAFVVALPPLADAWHSYMLMRLMEHANGPSSVNLAGAMPDLYRAGCWLLGAGMIGVAVIASATSAAMASHRELASGV